MPAETLPRVAVAPSKFVRGLSRMTDQADALIVMPLREALATDFGTDAHMVAYSVYEHGVECSSFPRLNKVVLNEIEAAGGCVCTTMLIIDLDTKENIDAERYQAKKDRENKVPWDAELAEEFWLKFDAAVDAGLPVPNVIYLTKNGARCIYVLREPVHVRAIEAYHRGLVHLFSAKGIVADHKCSDWTRLFRLPRVIRDGAPSWTSPYFKQLEQFETFINLADVPKVEKPQGADNYAPLKSIDRPRPTVEEAMAIREATTPNGTVSLLDEAKRRLQGRNCFGCLFDVLPIAREGERDATLTSYVGEAVAVLYFMDGCTPELIFSLFLPAVEELKPDSGTPNWLDKLWHLVRYSWSREVAKDEARNAANVPELDTGSSAPSPNDVPPFPEDIFPPEVEHALRNFGASLGDLDGSLVGPAALSALSAAIQFHLDCAVSPHHDPCPAGIETCAVASSGLGKSEVLKKLTREHRERDLQHKKQFMLARERFETHRDAIRERQKQMQREFAKERVNREHEPNQEQALAEIQREVGRIPEPPKSEEFIISDTTPEATVEFMAATRGETVFVISGEGTPLQIATGGQYSERVNTNQLCDIWSGFPVKFNRIRLNGLGLALREPRLAGAYALQPSKAAALAANAEARSNGFLARKLFTLCERTRLPRFSERQVRSTDDLSRFHHCVRSILLKPTPSERRPMRATPEAVALFAAFHDEVMEKLEAGGMYAAEHSAWGNRVLEHACRLSVTIEVAWRGIDSPAVSVESMERAIRLLRFFDAHYWALFGASKTGDDSVVAFAASYIAKDPNGKLGQAGLYEQFRAYCVERGQPGAIDSQAFWKRLKSQLGLQGQPIGRPRHFRGFTLVRSPASTERRLQDADSHASGARSELETDANCGQS